MSGATWAIFIKTFIPPDDYERVQRNKSSALLGKGRLQRWCSGCRGLGGTERQPEPSRFRRAAGSRRRFCRSERDGVWSILTSPSEADSLCLRVGFLLLWSFTNGQTT